MGSVLSKLDRNNQICIFPGVSNINEEEYNSEDFSNEEDKWMSDIYQYDQIVTIESNVEQLDLNNNTSYCIRDFLGFFGCLFNKH